MATAGIAARRALSADRAVEQRTHGVLIDCERTKHVHSGLYHFCRGLGLALLDVANPKRDMLNFYAPRSSFGFVGANGHYAEQHHYHKFFRGGIDDYDVWHCVYQTSRYGPASRKTRLVLTVHDLNFLIERRTEPAKIEKYLRRVQAHIDRASHIVCISEYTRRTVLEHLRTGDTPVDVIYNGCNIGEFPGFDAPAYRPSRPFLFAIGTLVRKKNFHVLPALLVGNDYQLVIAGVDDHGYSDEIDAVARSHRVCDRVSLVGAISEQEKHWYYKNCLAFAFPSVAEGFGLPVIEAMYYGKPVFASTHTSLPEIGGDAAYYFDAFDAAAMQAAFARGMADYERERPIERIKQHALRFSWHEAATRYLDIYRSLYR